MSDLVISSDLANLADLADLVPTRRVGMPPRRAAPTTKKRNNGP